VFYFLNVFAAFSVIIIKVLSYLLSRHCVACVTVLYSSLSLSLFVFTAFAGDY